MRALLVAGAAFVLLGGTAQAAEVKVGSVMDCGGDPACEKYQAGPQHNLLQFNAAPGEANDVVVTVTGARTLTVHDAGAPLTVGRQCTASGANDATCDLGDGPYADFAITLGDGADRLRVVGALQAETAVDAGPGDDDVATGDERDTLLGDAGSDRLSSGDGDDILRGSGGTVEPDALDGGPGSDLADYSQYTQPLTIDLASTAATQGAAGEGDTIANMENLWGGSGGDTLTGDDGDGSLRGGAGADVLDGRGGQDVLIGDGGTDRFRGGPGVDRIDSRDGRGEPVSCGAGADTVAAERFDDYYGYYSSWFGADASDVIGRDCEALALNGDSHTVPLVVDPRVRRHGARVSIANPCRQKRLGRRCRGTLTAKRARKPFARRGRRVAVRAGSGSPVRLKLRLRVRGRTYTTRFSAR
jgi:hypothetical protein